MNSREISNGILRAVFTIVLCCLFVYFLYKIQTVLVYLIVSLILTLIANPIIRFLQQRLKFGYNFAIIVTLVFFVALILGLFATLIPLISSQTDNLSSLNTKEIEKNFVLLSDKIELFLKSHGIKNNLMSNPEKLLSKIDFTSITDLLNSIISFVSNFSVGLVSVIFITFFMLRDKDVFIKAAKWLMPDAHEDKILNSVGKINELLSRYFIGLILQTVIIFVLYLIVLLIFGIDNAITIALLCAVLNIIPYLGPIISTALIIIISLLSNINQDFQTVALPTTIYIVIGFSIVQFIDNNITQPIIASNSVKSHPLEIFLTILIGGFLFGIVGMIIAVPLLTILKVIGKEFFPDNKFIRIFTKGI